MSNRILHKALTIGCCILAIAGMLVFGGFVLSLGLDQLAARTALPAPWPWLVNLGWLLIFALQHSGMARESFKERWTRIVTPGLERPIYVGLSGLVLVGVALTWQPLPGEPLWHLPTGIVALSLLGAAGTGVVLRYFDGASFLGLRFEQRAPEPLQVRGPFRFVRHPLMLCLLLFLWAQPVMPSTLCLLNAGLTLYIFVAIRWEERDLLQRFGQVYVEYRRRVPALLPWRLASGGVDPRRD